MVPKIEPEHWNIPALDYLLYLHSESARLFNDLQNKLLREDYMQKHRTKFMIFKCMDGRCNMSVFTKIQPGILDPMREMGAKFKIGWAHLQDIVMNWIMDGNIFNRFKVGVFTYHFSRSNKKLGCKAFDYDTDKAIQYAKDLQQEFNEVFQAQDNVGMFTVLWGMETDAGALFLHGHAGQVIDLYRETREDPDYWIPQLQQLYPSFPKSVIVDIFELVKGNISHLKEVKALKTIKQQEQLDHAEFGLAFGRGLWWLHKPNAMLIVGPFNPNPVEPISTAAGLLLDNVNKKRVNPEMGIALMTSVPFTKKTGFEEMLAQKKAINNSTLADKIIKKNVPDLYPYLKRLTCTINTENWELNILHKDD